MSRWQALHAVLVRQLSYSAVLRLSWVFALLIAFLPLAVFTWVPGHSMLGNLFVEYSFFQALGLGVPLFLSVWAVMLTTCLTLDVERARSQRWIDDPWDHNKDRAITIPIGRPLVFVLFTLLAGPAVLVVTATAGGVSQMVSAATGMLLGGLIAYLLNDVLVYLVRCDNKDFRVLPWLPFAGLVKPIPALGKAHQIVTKIADTLARRFHFWPRVYTHHELKPFVAEKLARYETGRLATGKQEAPNAENRPATREQIEALHKRLVKDSHLFGVWCLLAVSMSYLVVYLALLPYKGRLHVDVASQPPAAFLYALFLPLIFVLAPFWNALRRYRIALITSVLVGFVLYSLGGALDLGNGHTGPAHTYDVFANPDPPPLSPVEALGPAGSGSTLIVVAASGGGILATGWTATVLTELHRAYPRFRRELRLISAVSGGSVATAYYVSAHRTGTPDEQLSDRTLDRIVANSMKSSLAVTAYGFAFPDFRRAVLPILVSETFDRGRLLEDDWRRTGEGRRKSRAYPFLLSAWIPEIRSGTKPAVIFNTTVMETGERIAITPMSSLATPWLGPNLNGNGTGPSPTRRLAARTLAEFLGQTPRYSIDVWTAARLSATFSYISPAARAAIASHESPAVPITRHQPTLPAARQHLIDGGYHDNSGVASALDWLEVVPLPKRVALIEIRARPQTDVAVPIGQWRSAWFGPLLGLLSSWGTAQTMVSDTAINRLIARHGSGIQPFVFVMDKEGPLSWHLSRAEQKNIWDAWCGPENQKQFRAFMKFVDGTAVTNRCPRGESDMPPHLGGRPHIGPSPAPAVPAVPR